MTRQLLIAGGGIGGLAAGVAGARAGWHVRLFEQAERFSEVGAGLQLGPNATRVLAAWDLLEAVKAYACAPRRLLARDAADGRELGCLPLAQAFESRYGAPYLTIHRADLHAALLQAVQGLGASLHAGVRIAGFTQQGDCVRVDTGAPEQPEGEALVACDGLWSSLRTQLLGDAPPQPSDHVAYRGLLPMDAVPAASRAPDVTAWLGPRLHAVSYPVRGGAAMNIVCVVHEHTEGERAGWNHPGAAERLKAALGPTCAPLRALVEAVPAWGKWVLHDRAPVGGPQEMVRGRVALLGDAAHPMRPYLAQGAAMAIEDARELGRVLAPVDETLIDVPTALQRYALNRWERVARVQRRSLRNGAIFHATGPVRWARNAALRATGGALMDVPWLYGG